MSDVFVNINRTAWRDSPIPGTRNATTIYGCHVRPRGFARRSYAYCILPTVVQGHRVLYVYLYPQARHELKCLQSEPRDIDCAMVIYPFPTISLLRAGGSQRVPGCRFGIPYEYRMFALVLYPNLHSAMSLVDCAAWARHGSLMTRLSENSGTCADLRQEIFTPFLMYLRNVNWPRRTAAV